MGRAHPPHLRIGPLAVQLRGSNAGCLVHHRATRGQEDHRAPPENRERPDPSTTSPRRCPRSSRLLSHTSPTTGLPATVIRAPGQASKARGHALRPIDRRVLPRLTLQLAPLSRDELVLNTGQLIEGEPAACYAATCEKQHPIRICTLRDSGLRSLLTLLLPDPPDSRLSVPLSHVCSDPLPSSSKSPTVTARPSSLKLVPVIVASASEIGRSPARGP